MEDYIKTHPDFFQDCCLSCRHWQGRRDSVDNFGACAMRRPERAFKCPANITLQTAARQYCGRLDIQDGPYSEWEHLGPASRKSGMKAIRPRKALACA